MHQKLQSLPVPETPASVDTTLCLCGQQWNHSVMADCYRGSLGFELQAVRSLLQSLSGAGVPEACAETCLDSH